METNIVFILVVPRITAARDKTFNSCGRSSYVATIGLKTQQKNLLKSNEIIF